jgi:hypothetical protein
LENWRITSPSAELIAAVAALYGGEPKPWDNPAGGGQEWEVFTATDRLPVIVPPGDYAFSQWYELWSAGGCQRRCDGVTEQLTTQPCMCPADVNERAAGAAQGRACKMTTRLSVILPDVPDVGTWMLESHGYYAAVELAGTDEILRMAGAGRMIPAQLRIDQRTAKRNNETRRYAVPVLELTTVTSGQLTTGAASTLSNGSALTTLATGEVPVAVAGGDRPALPPPPTAQVQAKAVERAGSRGRPAPAISPPKPPALPGDTTPAAAAPDTAEAPGVVLADVMGVPQGKVLKLARSYAQDHGLPVPASIEDVDGEVAAEVGAVLGEDRANADPPKPRPPLPGDVKPDTRQKKMHALVANAWPEHPATMRDHWRKTLIGHVTAGRTESSKDLTDTEWSALYGVLTDIADGKVELFRRATGDYELRPNRTTTTRK